MQDIKSLNPHALVKATAEHYFLNDQRKPLKLASYQVEIISTILYGTSKRTLCWATTRAGKSLAVSIAIILKASYQPGRKIRIIAPTGDHTRIIMGYSIQHILDHPDITAQLTIDTKGMGAERLKKELSRQRITFNNGSEIMILTANIAGGGRSLLGQGGTDIIVDEAESIPSEILRARVMRMLGDVPDALLFLISNPTQKGFMYDRMKDPKYKQICIGWEDTVREGRLTREFIEERRAEMTAVEFDIWYNSIYPEEGEDQLIPWRSIEQALNKYENRPKIHPKSRRYLGVDVASMGSDYTVYTDMEVTPDSRYIIRDITATAKKTTMETAGRVIDFDRQLISTLPQPYKYTQIMVDYTGLGAGVVDRLKEQEIGDRVSGINFGQSPYNDEGKRKYLNAKAEMYFNLRFLFENRMIMIPRNARLLDQLSKLRFEFTSAGKIRIVDPDGHSPDEADSLALSCYIRDKGIIITDVEF